MKEKIALIEFVDEAEAFLEYCKQQSISPGDFHVVALQLQVQAFFKNLNITCENTLPFFSNDSHKRLMLKSEEWLTFLKDRVNLVDGSEIKESYNNTFRFYTRFYINYLLMNIEVISGIYDKYKLESIYACVYPVMIKKSTSRNLEENEKCAGGIAKMFAQDKGILFYPIPITEQPVITKGRNQDMNLISGLASKIISSLYRLLLRIYIGKKRIILITSTGYNLGKFVETIKFKIPESKWVLLLDNDANLRMLTGLLIKQILKILGIYRKHKFIFAEAPIKIFQPHLSISSQRRKQLETNIEWITENLNGDWKNTFIYKNINLSSIMAEIIEKHLKSYLVSFPPRSEALAEFIKSYKISLSVVIAARNLEVFLGELCRHYKVPGLMISHGTVKPPQNEFERIEYYHMGLSLVINEFYENAAIQTPSEEKHAAHYQCKNKLIRSGPLLFSKVDSRLRNNLREVILQGNTRDKILLYAPSIKIRTNLRFYVVETLDEFLSSAEDLVNAVNQVDGVRLMIRFHPALKIAEDDFRALLPKSDRLIIHKDKPFYEALSAADLSINYASTAIDDSLNSHVPVLLYDKWNRYKHYDGQELNPEVVPQVDAVYYVNNAAYLKSALKWTLENHLNKDVSPSIFDKYTYSTEYFRNIVDFISSHK